jgi:DNA-binding protein HU-beta
MNKTELIDVIADKADVSKAAAARMLDATIEAIITGVAKGNNVSLVGFGTFEARSRAAREGKNPRTGEAVKIAAKNAPAFKPGKTFKDRVAAVKPKKK